MTLQLLLDLVLAFVFMGVGVELFLLCARSGISIRQDLGLVLLAITLVFQLLVGPLYPTSVIISGLALTLALGVQKGHPISIIAAGTLAFGILYLGLLYWIAISAVDRGYYAELGLFYLALVVRDTISGIYGRLFPGRMITPISPRKTWQGSLIGAIAAVGSWIWIGLSLGLHYEYSLIQGVVAGVFGQIGDLLGSALKRSAGVRHSGAALGPMGGAIDLLDSALFTLPVWYFVILAY